MRPKVDCQAFSFSLKAVVVDGLEVCLLQRDALYWLDLEIAL